MITGSRGITNKEFVHKCLDSVFEKREFDLLLHGGAKGVDSIAGEWASEKGISVLYFKPDWKRYGRSAGIRRNTIMANECDFGIAIWDGKSKGTKDAIKKLKLKNKLYAVFKTEQMVSVS